MLDPEVFGDGYIANLAQLYYACERRRFLQRVNLCRGRLKKLLVPVAVVSYAEMRENHIINNYMMHVRYVRVCTFSRIE